MVKAGSLKTIVLCVSVYTMCQFMKTRTEQIQNQRQKYDVLDFGHRASCLTNKLDERDGNMGAYGPARSGDYAKPVGLKSAMY